MELILNLLVAEKKYKKPFGALLWQSRSMDSKEIERNQDLLLGNEKPEEELRFYECFNIDFSG